VEAAAVDHAPDRAALSLAAWSMREGLPQATVRALAQDGAGYLWVGTDAGLARFDGATFTALSSETTPALGVDRIRALLVDEAPGRPGTLWVGIDGGEGLVRLSEGQAHSALPAVRGARPACVAALRDRRGRLWLGSYGLVVRLEAAAALAPLPLGQVERLTQIGGTPVGDVTVLAEDAAGGIWLGGHAGVLRVAPDADRATPVALPSPGGAEGAHPTAHVTEHPTAHVTALLADPDGGMWVGTADAGLLHLDRAQRVTAVLADAGRVSALARAREGGLWVGSHLGLLRARHAGGAVRVTPTGIGGEILSLLHDRAGALWIGTRAEGLLRLGPTTVHGLLFPPGTPRGLAVTGTADGALWFGTDGGGLLRWAEGELRALTTREGLCTNTILALLPDGEHLWIGGSGGVTANLCRLHLPTGRFDEGARLPKPDWIRSLLRDRHGQLWVGLNDDGLLRKDGQALVPEPLPLPRRQVPWLSVYSLFEARDGALWVGSNQGLFARRGGAWRRFVPEDGLSNPLVLSIDEAPDGTLWFGTFAGFTRLRGGRFTPWKAVPRVTDHPVLSVLHDGAGSLWMGTARGLLRVAEPPDAAPTGKGSVRLGADLDVIRYGAADGLGTDRVEGGDGQASAFRDARGHLWFPTARGAAEVDPRALRRPEPPRVTVERVLVDGRLLKPGLAEIGPGRGGLDVTYAAISIDTPPERLRFRYRLTPFEPRWIDAGDRRAVSYTNLPPGKYTFQVTAAIEGGAFNPRPAAVSWRLLPHLHQTRAFRYGLVLLLIGLGVAAAWGVHRNRVATLEARHEAILIERNRIGRDLHDSLAQGFTGVSVQLEAATRALLRAPERTREHIDQARALVRASLADARRAVWELRPVALEEGDLVTALSNIARRLGAGVPIRVQVDGAPRPVPATAETALVRAGQEALTNAVRHAGASHIVLSISFAARDVTVSVKDDGAGFEAESAQPGSGLGLRGLRERMDEVGGKLIIDSGGQGTTVTAVVDAPP
jgi:signal transduction histidine kinase/ligand-binding sensor domain-containing protein